MAATVSAWGKPGAWALDSEENEAELLDQHKQDAAAAAAAVKGISNTVELADYPSLAAAASTKTKKKKPQTLSLQEFTTYGAKPPAMQSKGLTLDEVLALPTGPRERSAEELERNKGFRSYGVGSRDDYTRRQGSFSRESNRESAPSRADEIDNWGAGKKLSEGSGFDRRDRGGFFESSQSRADEVDNWSSKKSFVPSEPRRYDKNGSFGTESINGGADSDNWVKRKEDEGRKIGGSFDSLRDRRGGLESNGANSESWGRKREEVSTGSGRPRLNLQPRSLPISEGQKSDMGSVVKPKGNNNPFGEARPREEVLKEKGQDWKEIEEKLESAKTKEISSVGSNDGPVERKGFWSGSGRERSQREGKIDRAWRKPDSPDSRSSGTDGGAENATTGHTEETEEGETQV